MDLDIAQALADADALEKTENKTYDTDMGGEIEVRRVDDAVFDRLPSTVRALVAEVARKDKDLYFQEHPISALLCPHDHDAGWRAAFRQQYGVEPPEEKL